MNKHTCILSSLCAQKNWKTHQLTEKTVGAGSGQPVNESWAYGAQRQDISWVVHILSMLWNTSTHAHTHLKQSRLTHYSGLTPWGHGKALCGCPWSLQGNGERMGCACLELFHLQRHDGFQATTSSETFHTHHVNKGTSTYTHTRDGAFEFWQQLFSCPDFY